MKAFSACRYINFVFMATRDSSGVIDGIFVHAMDVTDVVDARIQVEESEARYRFLAESIPQMVWTAAPDGALDYVSGQVASYFGMRIETLLGDRVARRRSPRRSGRRSGALATVAGDRGAV